MIPEKDINRFNSTNMSSQDNTSNTCICDHGKEINRQERSWNFISAIA